VGRARTVPLGRAVLPARLRGPLAAAGPAAAPAGLGVRVGSPTTLEMCARGNLGYMGVNIHAGMADFSRQCEFFRESAVRFGREYDPSKIGWLTQVHVGDSDEEAMAEFAPLASYGSTLARGFGGPGKTFFPPGHLPPERLAVWEREARELALSNEKPPMDSPLIGSPETVAHRLIERLKAFKIGNVVISFQFGKVPHDMATRSMQLFADEVMPVVRRELDTYLDDLYPSRTQASTTVGASS